MVRSTLAVFAAQEDPVVVQIVPGDARQCLVSSDRVRFSIAALVYWWLRLLEHNFSLDGDGLGPVGHLPADAFYVDLSGVLKGSLGIMDRLVPVNNQNQNRDMIRLAHFARDHIYRTQQFPNIPPVVRKLLHILDNFQPNQHLLLKTHPALEDAIGVSTLFTKLYSLLMAMKKRNIQLFNIVMAHMEPHISSPTWVSNGIENRYLHQLMRVASFHPGPNPYPGPNSIVQFLESFLSTSLKVGNGNGENCLRVRRNGESHLIQDYTGVPAMVGKEEGFAAALRVVNLKNQAVLNPLANADFAALPGFQAAPLQSGEARAVASAIVLAVSQHPNNSEEAREAALGAVNYLCAQTTIYPHPGYRRHCPNFSQQQQQAANMANNAVLALPPQQPQPLINGDMFDFRDACNMLNLMDPDLVCTLHEEMFNAGELQRIAWHWDGKDVNFPL